MRNNTVFSQLLQFISQYRFKKCVDRCEGDKYTKRFNCWQQLIVLLFAQAKGLDSLRDIEVSMRSHYRKWYHPGLTSVARSALADANNNRNSDIFRDVFYALLERCVNLLPSTNLSLKIHYIPLIQLLSTCVYRSFPGRRTARRKERLSFIPCSTTAAICRRFW